MYLDINGFPLLLFIAKPIDLLARYVAIEDDDDVTIEMHEPYTYLNVSVFVTFCW